MKLRELRQIIREEISKARLNEAPLDNCKIIENILYNQILNIGQI